MPTLFVDCRHALLLRTPQLREAKPTVWQANLDVVAAIERWQQHGEGAVVLWSDRGADDADLWRRRVLPHLGAIECLSRDAAIPQPGDILIDSTPMHAKGTRYAPEQSFMVAARPAPPQNPAPIPAATAASE